MRLARGTSWLAVVATLAIAGCSGGRETATTGRGFRTASVLNGPPSPTNLTSATFDFTSDDGTATFECQLDGSGFAPCVSPVTYTGLADGSHTFEVRDVIAGIPDPSAASYTWTIDATAPDTTILLGPSGTVASDIAEFTFSSTESPATFECSLDGDPYQACTSPVQYTGLSDGPHQFMVRSLDALLNVDISSAVQLWTVDTTPPNTTIVSGPASLTTLTQADFDFSATEVGATFECRIDGGAWTPCTDPVSFFGVSEGAHTLDVRALDAVGNTDSTPATFGWTVDATPPDTSFTVTPASLSTSASAGFSFDSSESPSTFECRLDGGAWGACASPVTLTGLADGTHQYDVRATDAAGNVDATPTSYSWTIDTSVPDTSFTATPALATTSTSATFALASTEGGVTYECRLDGAGFAPCLSPVSLTGLGEGSHTFEARAEDAAGNVDLTPATYTWTIDSLPPDTVIDVAPPPVTALATANFQFGSSEGSVTFECSLDGSAYAPCAASASFPALSDGTHTLDVRAVDAAGNVDATPANHSWLVDTTAPDTTIATGPTAVVASASATFTFTSNDPAATFECRIDAGAWSSCSSPTNLAGVAEGAHTFEARAVDAAGNTDASPASYAWTVDLTAPDTTIASAPPAFSNSNVATFNFSASEPGVTYECELDSGGFVPCTNPAVFSGLSEASHTLRVRAVDGAGNADATEAAHSWTVDVTAPSVTILSGPASIENQSTATFTFDSNDPGATFQCRIDSGAYAACAATYVTASLADGARQLSVRAVDAAGNVTPGPEVYFWTIDTTAPNTSLDSSPPSPTQSDIASFTFSSPDAPVTFECSVDMGLWTACSSPFSLFSLTEGAHSFAVRARDAAGNVDPSPATANWIIDLTPPETSITSSPNLLTNSSSATFTFVADEPGSTFACALDSGAFLPCTSPRIYAGLSEGLHSFQVKATDALGQEDTTPASYSWTVDTTPPTTIFVSVPPVLTNATAATFDFDSDDPTSNYECRLDSAPSFTPCNDPALFTGLAHGSHGLEVRAVDGAGNVDATSIFHAWDVDLIASDTSILTSPPLVTNNASATFTFAASEMGTTFECRLDTGAYAPCTSPQNYPSVSEGAHTFAVRAVDAAGNADASPATFAWTLDTTPPDTSIVTDPGSATPSTSATFGFSSNEAGATFECSLDGGAYGSCTSPVTYTGLSVGAHTFAVRASDAFQTDPTPATFAWTIDQTPPDTSFTATPSDPSRQNPPVFGLASTEPSSTFECRLDGVGLFATCAASPSLGTLTDGSHTLEARAVDSAGNTDGTPATYTWVVDTTPPDTTASIPAYTTTNSASITLGSTETPATFECRLDAGAWGACTSPATYLGLADGGHTLLVRSIDAAGNVDTTPASATWIQDTVAPTTTILTGPVGTDPSTNVDFVFSASEIATFECQLNGVGFTPCTSPANYTVVPGPNTFDVRATDTAGNVGTPATRAWVVGTDPDTDGDGITDSIETFVTGTLPNDDDSDDDGLLDGSEDTNGNGVLDTGETDPLLADTDGDGIQDGTELGRTTPQGTDTNVTVFQPDLDPLSITDPRDTDTDGGSVLDGIEDANHNGRRDAGESDPTIPGDDFDIDADGIDDTTEAGLGTNPADADSDDDGIVDGIDGVTDNDGDGLIDALDPDSDNDGVLDGTEAGVTRATASPDTDVNATSFRADADPLTQTNPKIADTDGDGLSDGEEDISRNGRVDADESSPLVVDTDGDGITDFVERRGQNPTNPNAVDTDGDGLRDGIEDQNRNGRKDPTETDPNVADTDGDGVADGVEVANGTDPLDVVDGLEASGGGCSKGSGRRSADLGWGLILMLWFLRRRDKRTEPRWLPFVLFAVLLAPEGRAENASTQIDMHRLRLGAGESDIYSVLGVPTTTWRKFRFSANVGYASDILNFQTAGGGQTLFRPIENQRSLDLTASYGITDRSDVAVAIAGVMQSTQVPAELQGIYPRGLSSSGLGDARVTLKYRLSELSSPLRFGFALGLGLPSGDSGAYLGNGAFTFQPRLLGEYLFANGTRLVGNVGAELRPERQLLNLTVGSELLLGVGVAVPVRRLGKGTRVLVDATGALGLSSQASAAMPFEVRAGMSFRPWKGIGIQFAYGRGLTAGYGTPSWRGFVGVSFGESTSPITDGYQLRAVPKTAAPTPGVSPPTDRGKSP